MTSLRVAPHQSAAGDSPTALSSVLEWTGIRKPKYNPGRSGDMSATFPRHDLSEFFIIWSRSMIGVLYHHTAFPAQPKESGLSIT